MASAEVFKVADMIQYGGMPGTDIGPLLTLLVWCEDRFANPSAGCLISLDPAGWREEDPGAGEEGRGVSSVVTPEVRLGSGGPG